MTQNNKNIDSAFQIAITFLFFLIVILLITLVITLVLLRGEIKNELIVDAQAYDWFYNMDNPNEMFFQYTIFNYGNQEAKNVTVTCKLLNVDDKVKVDVTSTPKNIASNSYLFEELDADRPRYKKDMVYSSVCFVKSCDNCRILWKSIPDMVEFYNN